MPRTIQAIIELDHVSQRFPDGKVCPVDVSLKLHLGELALITGGNGAGKSTLMNILSLMSMPTEGTMTIFGYDVNRLSNGQLNNLRENIEYIPQKLFGLQSGSALWNIQHLLEYEMNARDAKRTALEALQQVQTPHGFDIHKNIAKLSGGEKGRVAIALALARKRRICLVDEILADVDVRSHVPLIQLFRQMTQQEVCVVMIAHIPGIEAHFDRVIEMESYRVISDNYNPNFVPRISRSIPGVQVPPQPTSKSAISRRKFLIGAGIVTGLSLAGFGAYFIQSLSTIGRTPASSTTPSTNATPNPPIPGTTLYTYRGHRNNVLIVTCSPDGEYIASVSEDLDGEIHVWEALTGKEVVIYRGHSYFIYAVAWSPDGKYIASVALDNNGIHIWEVWEALTGKKVRSYPSPFNQGGSSNVAWSPDSKYIVLGGGEDNKAHIYEALTGKEVFTYSGHSGDVVSIAWSPDGKYIASASVDVQVWEALTGKKVVTYNGNSNYFHEVAWSPDGKYIASVALDNNGIHIWEALTGKNVFTYGGYMWALAWSPNSKYIASVPQAPDKTVRVWEALTGTNVLTYQGHSEPVQAVSWSPNDRYIASGSNDKTVQVWEAP